MNSPLRERGGFVAMAAGVLAAALLAPKAVASPAAFAEAADLVADDVPLRGVVVATYSMPRSAGNADGQMTAIFGYDLASRANFSAQQWTGRFFLRTRDGKSVAGFAWPEDQSAAPYRRTPGTVPPDDEQVGRWLPFAFARDVLTRPDEFEWTRFEARPEGGFEGELLLPFGHRWPQSGVPLDQAPMIPVSFVIDADGAMLWRERPDTDRYVYEYAQDDPSGVGVLQTSEVGWELQSIEWHPDGRPELFTADGLAQFVIDAGFVPKNARTVITAAELDRGMSAVEERSGRAELPAPLEAEIRRAARRSEINLPLVGVGAVMLAAGLFTIIRRRMA
jgi:hypothetical protein